MSPTSGSPVRLVLAAATLALVVAGLAGTASWAGPQSPPPASPPEPPAPPTPEAVEALVGLDETRGDEVSILTEIHIPAGQVHRGQAVCIGCDAIIEGEVTHDIVVVGGSLKLSGKGGHDVVCIFSNVTLGENAEIGHDFVNVFGTLDDAGASIGNERVNIAPVFGVPGFKGMAFGVLGAFVLWWRLLCLVLTFIVLIVMAVFVPERVRTIGVEVGQRYGLALLAGLGGYVAMWIVFTLLAISIIGLPVVFILWFIFFPMLKILGLAGIFQHVGAKLGRSLGREMSLLGAVLLTFGVFTLVLILPHFLGLSGLVIALGVRGLYWLLLELPAVGLIILTRAGGRAGTRPSPVAPEPVVPPPPAVEMG